MRYPKQAIMPIYALICAFLVLTPVPLQACDPNCSQDPNYQQRDWSESSEIYGTVTDLSTNQVNNDMFVFVRVNEILLRTDANGMYSLKGVEPGSYDLSLHLPEGYSPAESAQSVIVKENEHVQLDLQYYSGSPPTENENHTPSTDDQNQSKQAQSSALEAHQQAKLQYESAINTFQEILYRLLRVE